MDTFSTVTHGMIPCFLISILCWSNESQATNQEVWKDDCLVSSKSNCVIDLEKEDESDADCRADTERLE